MTLRILVIGGFANEVAAIIRNHGDEAIVADSVSASVTTELVRHCRSDALVSFGYERRIAQQVISATRCLNLHGGLLPWNRGPNPNLWCWLDDTPKGVTIHRMTEEFDAGPILVQRESVGLEPREFSLRSSFLHFLDEALDLLMQSWPALRDGTVAEVAQPEMGGSTRTLRDEHALRQLMQDGIDWPLDRFVALARERLDEAGVRPMRGGSWTSVRSPETSWE